MGTITVGAVLLLLALVARMSGGSLRAAGVKASGALFSLSSMPHDMRTFNNLVVLLPAEAGSPLLDLGTLRKNLNKAVWDAA